MEGNSGVHSCCVLVVTFLSLFALMRTSQGQPEQPQLVDLVTEPEAQYYITKKQPANVTCEALGVAQIYFVCAGSQIPPSSQKTYQTFDESRGRTLTRSTIQVSRSDVANHKDGEFSCHCFVTNDVGDQVAQSRAGVISMSFLRKKFQEEPESQTVFMGSQAVFSCIPPVGKPIPEILWRKDGDLILPEEDDNFVIGPDGSLTILTARVQDEGAYECIARNDAGRRESAAATLTVEDAVVEEQEEVEEEDDLMVEQTTVTTKDTARPRNPRDTIQPIFQIQPPQEIFISPTQPVSLICDATGLELMTIRCNGRRVDAVNLDQQHDRNNRRSRIVLNVTYAEVENYLNSFREDAYKCECVAWYTIPGNQSWHSLTSQISSIYLAFLQMDFLEQPSDITGQVGTEARLTCQPPEGRPNPWIHWVFEQERLDPRSNSRYTVDSDGSLTISNLDFTDEGRYYCVAENTMGIRQSGVGYLTVTDEAVAPPTASPVTTTVEDKADEFTFPAVIPDTPVFLEDLQSEYYLDEKGEVTLECTVVSADMLSFNCNGERFQEAKVVLRILAADRQSGKRLLTAKTVVTRNDLISSQVADYKCFCNAWYIVRSEWRALPGNEATVRQPFLDSTFQYEPRGGLFYLGDTAEFACSPPRGQPMPTVVWKRDGTVIDPAADTNYIILRDGALIVETVRETDAGEYVCEATNSAGTRKSTSAFLELGYYTTVTTTETPAVVVDSEPTTPTYSQENTTTDVLITTMGKLPHPVFAHDRQETAYIIRQDPAYLECRAVAASLLAFFCNEVKVPPDQEIGNFKTVNPVDGMAILEKQIVVSRDKVEAHQGSGPYSCQCRAYYKETEAGEWQYISSENTIVQIAYLRREFQQQPVQVAAELGATAELICRPPLGVPTPTVRWIKDGIYLSETNSVRVTSEGSLVIEQVDWSSVGNYTCEVENIVNKRHSNTVPLIVREPGTIDAEISSPKPEGEAEGEAEGKAEGEAEGEPEGEVEPEGEAEGEVEPEGEAEGEAEVEPEGEGEATPEGESEGEAEGEGKGDAKWETSHPAFVAALEPVYYIIRSRPVTLSCQVSGVDRITFSCNEESVPQSRVQFEDLQVDDLDVMAASIEISREEVENYNNQNDDQQFYCRCYAHYTHPEKAEQQQLESEMGFIQVGCGVEKDAKNFNIKILDLKKMFKQEPSDLTVDRGEFVSLPCEPPEGNPKPDVHWLFNGKRVDPILKYSNDAYVIPDAQSTNAGTYVCVASNLANIRSSKPANLRVSVDGVVVTGSYIPGSEPEPEGQSTPEYGEETPPMQESPQQTCVRLLQRCPGMPQIGRTDQHTACQNVSEFVACIDKFVKQCEGIVDNKSIKGAKEAKMAAERDCGSRTVCQELMFCQSEYSSQSSSNSDASTVPMVVLCMGIPSFLRCAEKAAQTCNIPQDNPNTSLTDLAEWFEEYCEKVVDDEWAMNCPSLNECGLPIEQTTILSNLVQASLWCPYILKTMDCTATAVNSCNLDDVEGDLEDLWRQTADTCPAAPPEPESGGEDDDGKGSEGGNNNIGQSSGNTADGNEAWSLRASMLLTSLVPVAFVLLTCR